MKKLFLKKILYCTAIPVMSISPLFAQQKMNEMWGEQQAKEVQAGNERGHLFEWGNYAMFIHWGLYSSLARHEWVMRYEKIAPEEYEKYMAFFESDLYNPKEWARMAKEAGMKYAVITTKHHEGFCMFETKYTDYQSINAPLCRKVSRQMTCDASAWPERGWRYESLLRHECRYRHRG